jgi:hypothetical protein
MLVLRKEEAKTVDWPVHCRNGGNKVWRCAVLLGSHAIWLRRAPGGRQGEASREQQHIGLFVSRLPRCLIVGMYERVDNVGETGWRPCAVLLLLSGRGKGFTVKIRASSIDDDMSHLWTLLHVWCCSVESRVGLSQ